ncbi:MAG: lmo0937 family membrane protein [bacterium]|jgi:hypothetical protein
MLSKTAGILVALWLLGLATSYTGGGFTHVFLVIAITLMLVDILRDRRTCKDYEVLFSGRDLAEKEWNISGISLYQLTRRNRS